MGRIWYANQHLSNAKKWIVILFIGVSCTPLPSPQPQPTSSLEETPVQNTNYLVPQTPVVEHNTQLEFLVDHSQSTTRESNGCGELGESRFKFVDFMISALKGFVSEQNMDRLIVGTGFFGITYNSIQPLVPISKLYEVETVPSQDATKNTKYQNGIQGAIDKMLLEDGNNYQNRILVVVTDGIIEESLDTLLPFF